MFTLSTDASEIDSDDFLNRNVSTITIVLSFILFQKRFFNNNFTEPTIHSHL
jgi:hypothetical protein